MKEHDFKSPKDWHGWKEVDAWVINLPLQIINTYQFIYSLFPYIFLLQFIQKSTKYVIKL